MTIEGETRDYVGRFMPASSRVHELARAVASGGTGRALQAVPPADRDKVAHAAHHAFVNSIFDWKIEPRPAIPVAIPSRALRTQSAPWRHDRGRLYTIALVSVAVAAVGSVAGYALVRSRDFVGVGGQAAAPPEPA